MFLEVNMSVYVIISIILFLLYFINRYQNNTFGTSSQILLGIWSITTTIIGIYIGVNSSFMDKSMVDSTTYGITYLICCITLLSGAYIVQYMSS